EYPVHPEPVKLLKNSTYIICCDGAVNDLENHGIIPSVIIGDMDSINQATAEKYREKLVKISDQNSNDLEKAISWCHSHRISDINIFAATGLREDHTVGNIFLIAKFTHHFNSIRIFTNHGIFESITGSKIFQSFPGQAVSIFSTNPKLLLKSNGLKYPLNDEPLKSLESGCLNASIGYEFSINALQGEVIVFTTYKGITS
ncbi:MAG: thiamine diphosphokinase, partial [Fidelibacterota bacterium]